MIKNINKAGDFYNLPNIIHRTTHDNENSFNIQSAKLYDEFKNGKGLEILSLVLSSKGDAENAGTTQLK